MILRRIAGFALALLLGLGPLSGDVYAIRSANVGFTVLTYVCPGPFTINFSWTPAANAVFYSLALVGPQDAGSNGGVSGSYLRQFGAIEVMNGPATSASVSLSSTALAGVSGQQWQVMVGGPNGYTAFVPRQQVALVPIPCTATTPVQSPYF